MTNKKIILTADEIPANSAFTLEEWQSIADEMQTLRTDNLITLRDWLITQLPDD